MTNDKHLAGLQVARKFAEVFYSDPEIADKVIGAYLTPAATGAVLAAREPSVGELCDEAPHVGSHHWVPRAQRMICAYCGKPMGGHGG